MKKPIGIFDGKPIHTLFYSREKEGCCAGNYLLKSKPGSDCHN